MSNKPLSVADFLQEGLPKKTAAPGILLRNKFQVLDRDRSSSSSRGLSPFKKRRIEELEDEDEEDADEDAEVTMVDPNLAFNSMANEEASFGKGKEIIESIKDVVEKAKEEEISAPMRQVLKKLMEYMEVTTGMQRTTASVVVDSVAKLASPRMSRKDMMEKKKKEMSVPDQEQLERENKKKKFMNEVREAERSVLLFNTNMGTVPVMNPETMRKRFTADLVSKAARVEERSDGRPSPGVVSQLDDALSMITKMEYFGKVTKKATVFNDQRRKVEADFYTIPVKVCFKDKTMKEAAESRLSTMCKVSGSTPNPSKRHQLNHLRLQGEVQRRLHPGQAGSGEDAGESEQKRLGQGLA